MEEWLVALQRILGKPDKTYPPSEVSGALRLHYHNAESSLSVNVAELKKGWVVTETYQREPQLSWR